MSLWLSILSKDCVVNNEFTKDVEVVAVYLKALSRHLPEGTEEKQEN